MKKIHHINTTKNFDERIQMINPELISKTRRKGNKTPETYNNMRKNSNQRIQNFEISFDHSRNFRKMFRNKEECQNYMLYKKILISKTKYNKIISILTDIDKKLKDNKDLIDKLNLNLKKLKKNKKQKQSDIVNLLSNKESLEEIYKGKMYSLLNKSSQVLGMQFINGQKSINPYENISSKNEDIKDINKESSEYNPCSSIALFKENNFEVNIEEIKMSDKKKYEEQLISFVEEILQKKDIELRNKLKEKIHLAYQVFFTEIESPSIIDSNIILSNFFTRISLFISNQSLGNYSESFIDSFLKHILKINCINVKIAEIIKFLNKIYKDNKTELKDRINNLLKKNENLKNKKKSYETKKNELKEFLDENLESFQVNDDENNYTSFMSDICNFSQKRNRSSLRQKEEINNPKKDSCVSTRVTYDKINNYNKNKYPEFDTRKPYINSISNENAPLTMKTSNDYYKLNENDKKEVFNQTQNKGLCFKISHIKYRSVNANDFTSFHNQKKLDKSEIKDNRNKKIESNRIRDKRINKNKIFNVSNYQINNSWNNNFNTNTYNKDYIDVNISNLENSDLNKNGHNHNYNDKYFSNFNNYILDINDINKKDKQQYLDYLQIHNNRNDNAINVNNLLINNNISIENNNIINNSYNDELGAKEHDNNNKVNPKIQKYNTNIFYNNKRLNNFKLNNDKNKSLNGEKIVKRKRNEINKTPLKEDINRKEILKKMNLKHNNILNKTEIKSNDGNKDKNKIIVINSKLKEILNGNKKTNYNFHDILNKNQVQNMKTDYNNNNNILLSKDNGNNTMTRVSKISKRLSNINSPPQSQKYNKQKQFIFPKENKGNEILENTQKNKIFNNTIFKISKSPIVNKKHDSKFIKNSDNKNIGKFHKILSPKNPTIKTKNYFSDHSRNNISNNNNNNYNYNMYINVSKIENPSSTKRDNSNISKNSNNNSNSNSNNLYSKRYNNRLKELTQGTSESFCYFKTSNKNNVKFDPLDNCCTTTPEISGYIEGHILLDINLHNFKIIYSKVTNDKKESNSNLNESSEEESTKNKVKNFINVDLTEVKDIQLSEQMKIILKIYSSFVKYSSNQKNVNINKFISLREISDIPMNQNDKIKSVFCNFFMFTLLLDKKSIPKIDFIFINYEEFNLWHNCFDYVIKTNELSKKELSHRFYNRIGSPIK